MKLPRLSLRVLRCPPRGRCACGPAKPVPRPVLVLNAVRLFSFLLLATLAWLPAGAQAESVALAGMLGSKALLIVDGTPPKTVAAGETHQGVKVISNSGDQAVIEQAGRRQTLRVSDAPVSGSGGGARETRIMVTESGAGHFLTAGQINGRTVQFMVDTGATSIAMSTLDAERAGAVVWRNWAPQNGA